MGLFSGIGKAIKKVGKVIGKGLKFAAPILGKIPGVGTVGGALLGAGGDLISGGNLGSALKTGLSSVAFGKLGDVLGGGAAGGAGGVWNERVPSVVGSLDPTSRTFGKSYGYDPTGQGGGGEEGGISGALRKAGAWAKRNPELLLAGANAISGAAADRRSSKILKRIEGENDAAYKQGLKYLEPFGTGGV